MSDSNPKIIPLPGQFVQVQLGALKDIVNHLKDDSNEVQFDAQAVERVDGAGVQFLLAVARLQGDQAAIPLVINANEVLQTALQDMGVNELINVTVAEDHEAA